MKLKYLIITLFLGCNATPGFSQCIGTEDQVTWQAWRNTSPTNRIEEVYSADRYPKGPEVIKKISTISAPLNYDENFGGQIKGYIYILDTIAPYEAQQVIFNVTADFRAQFYLSSDDTADNKAMIASVDTETSIDGHTVNPSQTSTTITLQPNQNYYFELNYVELSWSDFANVYWKTTFLDGLTSDTWLPVSAKYLKDVCDTPCTDRGTPCDDNNANTINDQADGNCNCVGDPVTTNTCVGLRDNLHAYIYENIIDASGSDFFEELLTASNYPDQPDRIKAMPEYWFELTLSSEGEANNYGTRLQAYLTVPVTGNYNFNITGSLENQFYLSSDETEANKTANSILTRWWTGYFGHISPTSWAADQTMSDVFLEAGKYYYVEFLHRGTTDYSFYSLFWNGPQHEEHVWKRVPTFYFFDYTCETACVKAGVVCDDQDPYTANDIWDGQCICAGTPCTGPDDCDDPNVIYPMYKDCGPSDKIDNTTTDSWLSCAPISTSPNPARGNQHWIQYNFGASYKLSNIHVWNYNVADATASGFEEVVIDYSLDGIHWMELGTYDWELATGDRTYEGFDITTLLPFTAQYILITSLDPSNTCRGISKITFTAFDCPSISFAGISYGQEFASPASPIVSVNVLEGTTSIAQVALYLGDFLVGVDETAPYTWNGTGILGNLQEGDYTLRAVTTDEDGTTCEEHLAIKVMDSRTAECQDIPLVLPTVSEEEYRTTKTITSTATVSANTAFVAQQSITLQPNFRVTAGTEFLATIEACTPNTINENLIAVPEEAIVSKTKGTNKTSARLYPNPVQSNFSIAINAIQEALLSIEVYDLGGRKLSNLSYQKSIGSGRYTVKLLGTQLPPGLYYCKIIIGTEVHTTSFVKGE